MRHCIDDSWGLHLERTAVYFALIQCWYVYDRRFLVGDDYVVCMQARFSAVEQHGALVAPGLFSIWRMVFDITVSFTKDELWLCSKSVIIEVNDLLTEVLEL